MSVTPSSTMVGVFKDRTVAEHAMDALYNAGFKQEQIRYSAPGVASGFFEDLKSLFTGTDADNLANNLTSMGLSDDEAHYYVGEYSKGSTIIAVNAPDREQDAMNILRQYGAYNTLNTSTGEAAQPQPQSVEDHPVADQQTEASASEHTAADTTSSAVVDQQTEEHAPEYTTADTITSTESATPADQAAYQAPSQDTVATSEEDHTAYQASPQDTVATSQDDVAASEPEVESEAPQTVVTPESNVAQQASQDGAATSANDTAYEAPQDNVSTSEQGAVMPTSQPTPAAPTPTDYWQQLQEELQATQQQLDEAKSRLQAAKEREGQIQGAKQRLQELQSELQATLAELYETETRIEQYR